MDISGRRVPVLIVTGQLGAGKTRFISRLLAGPDAADTAILVNEFAEVGIDQDIFEIHGLSAVVLPGGCICCTLRGEVRRALQDLLFARARGTGVRFSRIVVELSGAADPAPLVAEFHEDAVLRRRFRLGGVVTLADATTPTLALSGDAVAVRQIIFADQIVVSKSDLDPAGIPAMEALVRAINPTAVLSSSLDPAPSLNELLGSRDGRLELRGPLYGGDGAAPHGVALQAFYIEAEPAGSRGLLAFAETLADSCGESLIRLKGIVHRDEAGDEALLVEVVRGRLYPTELLHRPTVRAGRPRAVAIVADAGRPIVMKTAAAHGLRCT